MRRLRRPTASVSGATRSRLIYCLTSSDSRFTRIKHPPACTASARRKAWVGDCFGGLVADQRNALCHIVGSYLHWRARIHGLAASAGPLLLFQDFSAPMLMRLACRLLHREAFAGIAPIGQLPVSRPGYAFSPNSSYRRKRMARASTSQRHPPDRAGRPHEIDRCRAPGHGSDRAGVNPISGRFREVSPCAQQRQRSEIPAVE